MRGRMRTVGLRTVGMTKLVAAPRLGARFAALPAAHLVQLHPGRRRVVGADLHRRGGGAQFSSTGFNRPASFAQLGFWGIGGYASALTCGDLWRHFLDGVVLGRADQRPWVGDRSVGYPNLCVPTATPS